MNRDDIIRMAREAGFFVDELSKHCQPDCITHTYYLVDELLERFAALVAAHEREACAKDCETLLPSQRIYDRRFYDAVGECVATIRARGEA